MTTRRPPPPSLPHRLGMLGLGLTLSLTLGACGGSMGGQQDTRISLPSNPPPNPPDLTSQSNDAETIRQETARIFQRIQRERADAHTKPAALETQAQATEPNPSPGTAPGPTPGPACSPDTCEASEGICASAQTICAISARHPGEADFTESCTWASTRCDEARTRCSLCIQ